MSAHIFDGTSFAKQKEILLKHQIDALAVVPNLKTVVFKEDPAGMLYTRLKEETALRVGIKFEPEFISINDDFNQIQNIVSQISQDEKIHGLMIQKPMKSVWNEFRIDKNIPTNDFWHKLVSQIDPSKDFDCLSPQNQAKVYDNSWKILPATAQAVISILEYASIELNLFDSLSTQTICVLGKSEIVGLPLSSVLIQNGANVKNYGKEIDINSDLKESDIVISATGKPNLIKSEQLKKDCIVIDVGSPGADVEFESVSQVARFITPVPYGVGPVTVISLMENAYKLLPPLND